MRDDIVVTDNPQAHRFEITVGGARAGLVTYRLAPGAITFVHTEIRPELERQGLGGRLVRDALDAARARGLVVRPVCSFVADFIARNPDYADLVRDA